MMGDLIQLRHLLHSHPEISGKEEKTANRICSFLEQQHPDKLVTGLGGTGVAAVFDGKSAGPRVLIRCELDALPIPETVELEYGSKNPGAAHKCGHDGHMTILAGLAMQLHAQRLERGSVVLLFQPSEETGEGAARVISDSKYTQIEPDYVFALHNLPGYSLGEVILRNGLFASASSGLAVYLNGETSHAAEPEKGKSPALAVAELIQAISALPQFHTALHESAQATIIHANVGEVAFGTSPGVGNVMATLRSHSQDTMTMLIERATGMAEKIAATYDLQVETEIVQPFPSTVNDPESNSIIRKAASEIGVQTSELQIPFPWSEDFGHFTARHKGAMFGFGSGLNQPALHHPTYDFPDDLVEPGVKMFMEIIQSLIG